MKRLIKYSAVMLSAAAVVLAGSGCEHDSGPCGECESEYVQAATVTICLRAKPGHQLGTRADGAPVDPELDNEKICDWFVVIIDKSGKVAKVLSRGDAETGIDVIADPAVEQETFRCILPAGTYTAYAFANVTPEKLKEATGLEFAEGATLEEGYKDDIAGAIWDTTKTELNGWNIEAGAIPMSGHREEFTIKNTIEETLSIEVVRMVAKVQFLFSNPTDRDITVKSVSFDPVTSSSVALFPKGESGIDYAYLGEHAYKPLAEAAYDVLNLSLDCNVESGKTEIPSSFYMKESLSDHQNEQAFTVGLTVSHADGLQEYQQYNITKDIRGYINRNDWIVIPVTLSQYDISAEALFYPPIGGYPAVLSSTDPDGSQVFTFGTEGEFAIVPKVIDKITGQHLLSTDYTITLGTLSSDNNIFTKAPSLTASTSMLPHEITGILSASKGKARLPVEVKIGSHTYTRNIYIIRT